MREYLDYVRERYDAHGRDAGWWMRTFYHGVWPPRWMERDDRLRVLFKRRADIMREGRICWGATIQANMLLFSPGLANCPGEVVISLDPAIDDEPELLVDVARRIGELKGEECEDEISQRISDHLADEHERSLGWSVPESLAGQTPCCAMVTVFFRKHLPGRCLLGHFYPMLVLPSRNTMLTTMLPGRYWHPEFRARWLGD